LSVA
jgi:nitrate/nitrite transporter NarK